MKKFILTVSMIISGFVLIGFSNDAMAKDGEHHNDYVAVYNQHDKKVRTITNKKSVNYIADLTGDVGGNEKGIHKKIPKHKKVMYRYVLHNGKKRTKSHAKVNLYVYQDIKKVRITGLPVISNATTHVSNKQYHKLINPDDF